MIPYTEFLNTTGKIKTIMSKAYNCGLSAPTPNQSNQLLHLLKKSTFNKYMTKKLEYSSVSIDFKDFVPHLRDKRFIHKEFDKLEAYFCDNKNFIYFMPIGDRIYNLAVERKIIFINIGIDKYFVDKSESSNYSVHGVCLIMVPRVKWGYDMYYVNSHGNAMNETSFYQTIKTRTRLNRYDFGEPVDCLVMNALKQYLNTKYKLDIHYDTSKKHNYFGVNLQEGDNYGACFIFPIAIYFGLGMYFTEKKALIVEGSTRFVPTFKELLKNGNVDLMVETCFADFDKEITKILYKSIYKRATKKNKKTLNPLTERVEKAGTIFVKKLVNTFVYFISQKYFKDQLSKIN